MPKTPETNSPVLLHFLHPDRRALMRYHADGTIYKKRPETKGWQKFGSVKPPKTPEQRVAEIRNNPKVKPWMFPRSTSIPSVKQLREWSNDCGCESVTGEWTEADGTSADGAPSWLVFLGYI
jgi:hypothetical protein